jgi:hypothetical protein
VPGRIAVSVPEQDERGDWRCEAWLDGLDHRSWPLVGVTPLRAVVTATEHVLATMSDFVARGGRILTETGEDLDPLRD